MRIPAPLAVSLLMVLLGSAPFARQAQQPAQPPQPQPPAGTAAPPPQTAQPERSQQGPIRTGINYVRVDAIVTDRQGNPVLDLKPEEFSLSEDNKPQKIEQFSVVKIDADTQIERGDADGDPQPLGRGARSGASRRAAVRAAPRRLPRQEGQ